MLLRRVPRLLHLEGLGWGGTEPSPVRCMFNSRQQAVAWETVARHRLDLEEAVKRSNWPEVANVAEELLQCYNGHLAASGLTDDVASRTLGNAFAEALAVAAEALCRNVDDDKKAVAKTVFRALLDQRQHAQEKRACWVAGYTRLLETSDPPAAAEALICALEDGGHRGIHRALLEDNARGFLRRRNGSGGSGSVPSVGNLPEDLRSRLEGLLAAPPQLPPVTALQFAALPGKSPPSLKKVYVHQPTPGGQKYVMSLEERVMAHYVRNAKFSFGLDDEGETLVSLAVLAFWNPIYDGGVEDAWGSPCQDRPLDWASARFWVTRHMAMEERCHGLLQFAEAAGPEAVAEDLLGAREALAGTPSLVRWPLLQDLDIEGLIKCITVPTFVAICRRILSDFASFRSGFPDLLLWDPYQSKSLFVEVKGPKDELSLHQANWLEFLRQNGAAVAIVNVRAR